jgi:DNA polymerase-1
MIPVDPSAILLIDVGHIYWTAWHATQESAQDAYSSTYEAIMACHRNWAHCIVCIDSPRNWRHDISPDYKANRKPKPQAAVDGLVDVIDRVRANGVPVAGADGYEADDVIATLVAQSWLHRVVIRSDDKDLAQLVSEDVSLWCTRSPALRGPAEVQAKYGVPPHQIRDLLALWGDASDNIQGCPKVGQGKATTLLQKFGSLRGMWDAIDEYVKAETAWEADTSLPRPVSPLDGIAGFGSVTKENIMKWDGTQAVHLVSLKTVPGLSLDALLGKTQDDEW